MQRPSYPRPLYGLAAWSDEDSNALNDRLGAVANRLDAYYEGIAQAEAAGYPEAEVDRAYAEYDAFWAEINALTERLNEGADSGTAESLTAFDAAVEGLDRRIADWNPLGTKSVQAGRTSLLVYATLGSLVIAGAAAGLLYFFSRGRR